MVHKEICCKGCYKLGLNDAKKDIKEKIIKVIALYEGRIVDETLYAEIEKEFEK